MCVSNPDRSPKDALGSFPHQFSSSAGCLSGSLSLGPAKNQSRSWLPRSVSTAPSSNTVVESSFGRPPAPERRLATLTGYEWAEVHFPKICNRARTLLWYTVVPPNDGDVIVTSPSLKLNPASGY